MTSPTVTERPYTRALKALQSAHDACFKHPERDVLGMSHGPFSGVNEALGIIAELEDALAAAHRQWREADAAGYARGKAEMRERAAKVADAYANENQMMAVDSAINDPILSGEPPTRENVERAKNMMFDGCVHSSMFHASQNIAADIRALED